MLSANLIGGSVNLLSSLLLAQALVAGPLFGPPPLKFETTPTGEVEAANIAGGKLLGVDGLGNVWTSSGCFQAGDGGYFAIGDATIYSGGAFPPNSEHHLVLGRDALLYTRLKFFDHTCSDPAHPNYQTYTFGLGDPLYGEDLKGNPQVVATPDGRPCVPFTNGLLCLDFSQVPTGTERWLTPTELDAALGDPRSNFPDISASATDKGWEIDGALFLPGGRLVAWVRREYDDTAAQVAYPVDYLLIQKSDHSIQTLLGPRHRAASEWVAGWFDLVGGSTMAYDAATDTLIFPDFNAGDLFKDMPYGHLGGEGLAVLPLGRGVWGVLDATVALARLSSDDGPDTHHFSNAGPVPSGDGRVYFGVPDVNISTPVNGSYRYHLYRLPVDFDQFDLDRDGLSGAEEAALGTSDFFDDSDGDGVPDGLERDVFGTSPVDAGSGAVGRSPDGGAFGVSPLVRDQLPGVLTAVAQAYPTPYVCAASGPTPGSAGACFDASGHQAFATPHGEAPYASPDGRYFAWDDGQNIYRHDTQGGADQLLASDSAVARLGGGTNEPHPLLVARDGTVSVAGVPRLVALDGLTVHPLWDPQAVACDAGLNGCGPDAGSYAHATESVQASSVVGYDPRLERALVEVDTDFDSYLFGVARDGQATRLARAFDFAFVPVDDPPFQWLTAEPPAAMVADGYGGFWVQGQHDTLYPMDGAFRARSTALLGLQGTLSAAWGQSTLLNISKDYDPANPGQRAYNGLDEVYFLRRAVEPGDLVTAVLAEGNNSATLVRVGPRGGVLRLSDDAPLGQLRTLNRAPDGRVCVVGSDGWLKELVHPDAQGIPHDLVAHDAVQFAKDCLYSPDGTLYYLASDLPRLGHLQGETPVEARLDGVTTPVRFARSASGAFRVVDASGNLACVDPAGAVTRAPYAAAGVGYDHQGKLLLVLPGDGQLARLDDDRACAPDAAPQTYPFTLAAEQRKVVDSEIDVQQALVAERFDGRVVVQLAGYTAAQMDPAHYHRAFLWAWNPDANRTTLLSAEDTLPGLAQVPGGPGCDPWASDLPAGTQPHCLRGLDSFGVTDLPDGGLLLPDGGSPAPDGDASPAKPSKPTGCHCGQADAGPLGALALTLLGLLRRRRA